MFEQIMQDLKLAMKEQDKFKLSVLRMLKADIQKEKIKVNHELTDEEVIAVIKRQVKVRNSSKEEYAKYQRQDLVVDLEKEIGILKAYLPEELSSVQIEQIIDETLKDVGAQSSKDMGKVMKEIVPKLSNRADMSVVCQMIKDKLKLIDT